MRTGAPNSVFQVLDLPAFFAPNAKDVRLKTDEAVRHIAEDDASAALGATHPNSDWIAAKARFARSSMCLRLSGKKRSITSMAEPVKASRSCSRRASSGAFARRSSRVCGACRAVAMRWARKPARGYRGVLEAFHQEWIATTDALLRAS